MVISIMSTDLAEEIGKLICPFEYPIDFNYALATLTWWAFLATFVLLVSIIILGPKGHQKVHRNEPIKPSGEAKLGDKSKSSEQSQDGDIDSPSFDSQEVVNEVSQVEVDSDEPEVDSATKSRPGGEAKQMECPHSLGSDLEAVKWVNICLQTAFTNHGVVKDLLKIWTEALNDFSRNFLKEEMKLEFLEVVGHETIPDLSNITTQSHPNDNLTVTADLQASFSYIVGIELPQGQEFKLNVQVEKLVGRINLTVLSRERFVVAKMDGWPEINILVIPDSSMADDDTSMTHSVEKLKKVARNITLGALRGAQVTINLEDFDPKQFPVFRRTLRSSAGKKSQKNTNSLLVRPQDMMSLSSDHLLNNNQASLKYLSIRVVKVTTMSGFESTQSFVDPYVVIEIDDPSQRFKTNASIVTESSCEWDQDCIFDLNAKSSEVLFEVWDSGVKVMDQDLFLGLGIVAIQELMITSNQRHVIPLQGRPYQDKDVIHTLLTVQFVLLDPDLSNQSLGVNRTKETKMGKSANGKLLTTQSTTFEAEPHPEGDELSLTASGVDKLYFIGSSRTYFKRSLVQFVDAVWR